MSDTNKAFTQLELTRPDWIQLPKSGKRCPISSLSRSKLNQLLLPCEANDFKPLVKSISLKSTKQASRGIRLICTKSLREYLEFQATEQQAAEKISTAE